ncbi:MAG: efflux RND transporter periplasmic adaptor subunit [Magnetococcales bacterium]|nr:efflux RND transporter periplasmic adaptor subunit [Magnetococcales bacterium]
MTKINFRLGGMAVLAVLASWGAGLAAPPSPPGPAAPVLSVTVAVPQREQWPRTLMASGGIHAWQEAVVAAEIGGLAIVALPVDVGSAVKRGQELVRLSDEAVQAVLAQHRANVSRAEAQLALAENNADRARGLRDSSAMSEQQKTHYLLTERAARADLAAAQAALGVEEVRLRQTRITAADDGVISSRTASLGAVVQTGGELLRLLRQGRLEWRAELTGAQMAQVRAGMTARLTLDNGQTLEAVARMVAPVLETRSRRGLVYFDLPAGNPARAGLFAQGEIRLGEADALTLPQSAFVLRDGHAYLFELAAGDRVTLRKVVTGRQRGDRIEVVDGITPEARVVAAGGAFLHEGDGVRVVPAEGER